jgi:uncharacterized protein (UPF0332 family)
MYSSALALLLKKDISPKTHDGTLRQLGKEYVKKGCSLENLTGISMMREA